MHEGGDETFAYMMDAGGTVSDQVSDRRSGKTDLRGQMLGGNSCWIVS